MDNLFDQIINALWGLPTIHIYLFLGVSAFVENIFPPIPGDTIMAFGAFMVGIGKLDFVWVYIVTTFGSLLGFMSLFEIGMCLRIRVPEKRRIWFFNTKHIIKAGDWFQRYGYLIIILNRFLPGLRSAVAISGGIFRLNRQFVALFALISCLLWNFIWITIGYFLGNHWETVKAGISLIMKKYNIAVLIFLALLSTYLYLRWKFRYKDHDRGK